MKFNFFAVLLLSIVSLTASSSVNGQQVPVGNWRDHLPYSRVIAVTSAGTVAYAATRHGVFSYNLTDNSVERINKVNKLSDTGVSALAYNPDQKTLVVGYENGNVDLIRNGIPFNLADIKRSNLLADKKINNITVKEDLAYLATGFGIVVLDLLKQEVKDTYIIGSDGSYREVYHVEFDSQFIYASVDDGLMRAAVTDPFLANFQVWSAVTDLPEPGSPCLFYYRIENHEFVLVDLSADLGTVYHRQIEPQGTWQVLHNNEAQYIWDMRKVGNRLLVCAHIRAREYASDGEVIFDNALYADGGIWPNAMWKMTDGTILIADNDRGLITANGGDIRVARPSGPPHFNARRLSAWNNNIWVASGGIDQTWTNNFDKFGFYGLVEEQWKNFTAGEGTNEVQSINDIMAVAVDPLVNSRVAFGSWEEGLIVLNGNERNIYNATNSTLKNSTGHSYVSCMIAGLDYDNDGNLWISNSYTDRHIHMMNPSGEFTSFSFQSTLGSNKVMSEVLAAQNGYVWMVVPRSNGLLVMNPNGTPDDQSDDDFRYLTEEEGKGGLPSNDVYCVEEDLDGEIWVGTLEGVTVFYSPECIFTDEGCDAQQILIEQDGNTQILLATEVVTVIKIDGANRKWIGTQSSGVFLLSEDGLTQIHHFTAENSPLLSNVITDITINHLTGEVFFATDAGIIAYQGTATNFVSDIENIKVFPNPVTGDFEGLISIDGLAYKTNVKITDISGNLVYNTISDGGRAVWDGRRFNGEKVSSGVYLVFCTNADGSAKNVGKIAIVR